MKIKTFHVYPPIPDRRFDWAAWDDEKDEDSIRIGRGPTEEAAIADLVEQDEEEPKADRPPFRLCKDGFWRREP